MHYYFKYKQVATSKPKLPLKWKNSLIHCFIVRPKADHQVSEIRFWDFRWFGRHIVENILPIDFPKILPTEQ